MWLNIELILIIPPFFVAVQCERKPVEASREKSSNCAASTEKIYIRKDLRSPLTATPTFVTDSETARYANINLVSISLTLRPF